MRNDKFQMTNDKWFSRGALFILLSFILPLAAFAQSPTQPAQATDFQSFIARQASLVTEFDINGLKVLVKRRESSQTVAAGLFIRGGSENVTAVNAGIESLMLDVASEASMSFPRERMRKELSHMGTVIGGSSSYDYSVLSMTSTRTNFDRSWEIFTDVALHPTFDKTEFQLAQSRIVAGLRQAADEPDSYLQLLQEKVA